VPKDFLFWMASGAAANCLTGAKFKEAGRREVDPSAHQKDSRLCQQPLRLAPVVLLDEVVDQLAR
jgi:hypothetical protein